MKTRIQERHVVLQEKALQENVLAKVRINKARKRKQRDGSIGENPFKTGWKFPVTMTFDYCYLQDSAYKTRMSTATSSQQDLIYSGDFTPCLLEGKFVRQYMEANDKVRDKLYDLKGGELRLYLYIIFNLKPGNDFVVLNQAYFLRRFKVNRSSYYKYIDKLIDKLIIARSAITGTFFINVQLFFHGNRGYSLPEKAYDSKYGDLNAMKEAFIARTKDHHKNNNSKREI